MRLFFKQNQRRAYRLWTPWPATMTRRAVTKRPPRHLCAGGSITSLQYYLQLLRNKIAVKVNKTTNLSKSSNLLINFANGSFTRPEDAARQNEQSQGLVR